MQKYSIFSLIKNAFSNHEKWDLAWKDPSPKKEYDVVIIGGGGHGLATAYYLAKEHKITNVAVIEKGWIGGGNIGRNTTIIRSNFMYDDNARFNEFGMNLWRNMSQELNFNVMFSPRAIACAFAAVVVENDVSVQSGLVAEVVLTFVTAVVLASSKTDSAVCITSNL